jgi:succinate dehydrogenase/fumarate reductase iron-sulfur protein
MSAYILPIDPPEAIYTLHIQRYDPDRDTSPRWETFRIPWVRTMTVMEALEWLQDQGRYVAFRANCREFTCGSCAMLINGRPGLACDTPLVDNTRLQPLNRFPIRRDLVVDTTAVGEKWRELASWPHIRSPEPIENVPKASLQGWHRAFARCIECYACLDACPSSDSEAGLYAGPMWMVQIGRARAHPRDGVDRLEQAVKQGVGRCVSCYECAEVCPVRISPIFEIHLLRRSLLADRLKRLFRRGVSKERVE